MSYRNINVKYPNEINVEVNSPSTLIDTTINIPAPLESTTSSPSIDYKTHIILPGPQGPVGPIGPSGAVGPSGIVNTGELDLRYISITGFSFYTGQVQNQIYAISGYFDGENIVGYTANLTQGSDNYYINFPQPLSSTPKSVVCTFQNIVDNMAYYFNIGNINSNGFYINFSDILINNGYFLNIQVKK